jgi:uncharacterized protein (TIGR03437 family)
VMVTIGGTTLPASDVLYAGLSPQSISGLFQVNLRLPATLADGDVPVTMAMGGVQSVSGTTIPVKR